MEAIINYLDKYSTQIFVLQMGLLFIVSAIFLWVWFYNRKKYHNLKHQIPASVIKNYLDSIIQNSTSLKSSLFRGGGLDIDPSSIPSVLPLDQLASGAQVDINMGGDEGLRAEVARLKANLLEKQNIISELESRNTGLSGEVKAKQERIVELEKLLAAARESGGGESGEELVELTAQRDELKDKLAQYEIIEDDIADLKRLKQENEQLRQALEGSGGSAPVQDEAVAQESAPAKVEEETEVPAFTASDPDDLSAEIASSVAEASSAAAAEFGSKEDSAEEEEAPVAASSEESGGDKSPEDLLSEFEKMLG